MPTDQKPTSAAEWKAKKEGFVVELPSGNSARIRRSMDILVMLKQGRIPNPLAGLVHEMLQNKRQTLNPQDIEPEAFTQLLELVDQTAVKVMVEPRVEVPDADDPDWQPSEDAISLEDLTLDDKFFLFSLAQGGVSDLKSFREQQAEALAAPPDGGAVPRKAKRTARAG